MAIVAAIRQDMKELAETVGRKTKFAVSQPETRMSAIALGGWGSVKLLWWLNHLPADALAISAYPYQLAAVSTIGANRGKIAAQRAGWPLGLFRHDAVTRL